jgi:hypothetical protein
MTRRMGDLVEVQGGFKPSVQLPDDFFDQELNRHFVQSYVPTPETLDIFMSVRDSLQGNSEQRARSFVGTYGTGKSDLMLMIANYVTRSADDPLLAPFFQRLRLLNDSKAEAIYNARKGKPPFLLVLLQADTAITFSSFVLRGLADALEKNNLQSFLINTYYQAALNQIETWERDYPDIIQRLSDILENDYARTLNQLKNELQSSRGDSALDIFRPAAQKASGTPFQPTAVVERPSEAFAEVATKIVETGNYSGIFVIADEFTHLLQKLGESPTAADSKGIDNLAEKAVRSRENQLHFYVVSLQSFASAQGSTQVAQAALERSGGRFIQHELRSQNTEELISASIAKLVPSERLFENAQGQQDDLLTLAMRLWGNRATGNYDRQWLRLKVVQGCFPLHPLVTYCLPRLNAVLAQNERTMFRFIWDKERGLNRFISEASGGINDGWIALLSLDKLFDYFESTLQEKRPDLLQAYQEASQTLSPEQIENGMEGSLLRALVMLDVASGDANLRANEELLRHALGLPTAKSLEIAAALTRLGQAGIAYASQSGFYQLVKPGRANPLELRRQIERRAQELTGSPIILLNSQYKPENIDAQKYNSERGTSRSLTTRFISSAELLNTVSITPRTLQENDGLLWYVVASSEQELEQARATVLQLTRQHHQLIVAIPRNKTDLIVLFQRKRAWESLRDNENYKSQDYQDLLRDTGLVGKDYKTAFENALSWFEQPANFDWFRAGHTVTVNTPAHLSLQATTVMNEIFPATPAHKTRQHLKASGKSKYVENVLEKLLQSPFQLPAKKGGKKTAEEAIIIDGAGELGLINHIKQERGYDTYEVCVPINQKRNSQAVWLWLDEQLRQGTSWSDIVNTLQSHPYGLYSSIFQVFLAAFYRYNRDYLEVYSTLERLLPIDVTGKKIVEMIESPTKFVVRYQPLTDMQRKFLRGLAERALYPGREFYIQTGETASLRNRVAKLLRLWTKDISYLAKQASEQELASILGDVPEIISASLALIEIACLPSEAETATALLESLPISLGLADDSSQWDETETDRVLAYLESSCQQLLQFEQKFKSQIAGQVGNVFGMTETLKNSNEVLKVIQGWHYQFLGLLCQTDLVGNQDARDLLSILDNAPRSFEQAFLNTLASRWGLRSFEQWDRFPIRDEFLQRLEQAKVAVEAKATELALSSPSTTTANPPNATDNSETFTTETTTSSNNSATHTTTQVTVNNRPQISQNGAVTSKSKSPTTNTGNSAVRASTTTSRYNPRSNIQSVTGQVLSNNSRVVDEVYAQVRAIFERLSTQERYTLLQRLQEEYEPQ